MRQVFDTSARALVLGLCLLIGFVMPSVAQDGTARMGADYDIFIIGGTSSKPCAEACAEDPRCKAWSFVKARGQCRLLHTAVVATPNPCCTSGLKPKPVQPAVTEEATCADYAVEALDRYTENVVAQCGYQGPNWPANFRDAYGRCLDASPRRRQAEREERALAIAECKAFLARTDEIACDHFARLAVEAMKTNQANRCGLKGARWSERLNDHVAFCRNAPRASLTDVVNRRETALRECLARGGGNPDDAACNSYAEQSVVQVVQAQQLRCGRAFAGPDWTPDQAQHFAFCQATSPRDRQALLQKRAEALEQCEQDRKRFRFILKF